MSMEYCHAHDRHYDTDWDLECPECLSEAIKWEDVDTVELITHNMVGTRWAIFRDQWCIAQWLEAPATAIPHWHIWSCHADYMKALEGAMSNAKRGGRWAVVVADEEVE